MVFSLVWHVVQWASVPQSLTLQWCLHLFMHIVHCNGIGWKIANAADDQHSDDHISPAHPQGLRDYGWSGHSLPDQDLASSAVPSTIRDSRSGFLPSI